jgi:hypothetical protein
LRPGCTSIHVQLGLCVLSPVYRPRFLWTVIWDYNVMIQGAGKNDPGAAGPVAYRWMQHVWLVTLNLLITAGDESVNCRSESSLQVGSLSR